MNSKKMRFLLIVQVITLLLIILLLVGGAYIFSTRHHVPEQVEKIYNDVKSLEIKSIELDENIKILEESAHAPKDGIDGKNGRDGIDSLSTHTFEKTTVIEQIAINGKDGKDAPLFEPRCNVTKNRWEYRYSGDETWRILNGTPIKCTIEEK